MLFFWLSLTDQDVTEANKNEHFIFGIIIALINRKETITGGAP